jgi:signal transduction histidine kinase
MASLGVLAAGVAHEINNPLNFIYGGIVGLENYLHDHLKDHIGALTPMLEGIQTGARRAADIVTSLNHYSRYDDAPMAPCNIHSIIDNCLIMLSSELKYRIEIKKEYAEAYGVVPGNESKLHQAILNIIANAGQSIEDKGTIAIETRPEDSRLIIEISDSGCGISEENLPRITDPFFTTKDPGKGTGLGLSIAYNIIREHGGTLEFESQVGKGTKAILVLPAGSPG